MAKMGEKKFTVEIDLGNAAMCSPNDVAEALEVVTSRLKGDWSVKPVILGDDISDINGNTVGHWVFDSREEA